jgi:hypothetical protein
MKSKVAVIVISMLLTNQILANGWDNPNLPFDTSSNYTNQSTITWRSVDNVQKVCESESRKRGYGGFGYGLEACSFFDGNSCTVITGKKTTMHTLGHEVRHCFQGPWH